MKKKASLLFDVGVDEVGRGALAGPVIAAAVILPNSQDQPHFSDSKAISATKREALYVWLKEHSFIGLGYRSVRVIDEINILQASLASMRDAVNRALRVVCKQECAGDDLLKKDVMVYVDGNQIPKGMSYPAQAVVKGDSKVQAIAAASIVAKVCRDEMMSRLGKRFPNYGFENHKGYGSKVHREAIFKYGTLKMHRKSFCLSKQLDLF